MYFVHCTFYIHNFFFNKFINNSDLSLRRKNEVFAKFQFSFIITLRTHPSNVSFRKAKFLECIKSIIRYHSIPLNHKERLN